MISNFSDFFRELWSKGVKLSLYYIALQLSIWTQIVICYYKDIQASQSHYLSVYCNLGFFVIPLGNQSGRVHVRAREILPAKL